MAKSTQAEYAVILDTSFLIRLLNEKEALHPNALKYYQYFLDRDIPMYMSTISIAEYCVKGEETDLPFDQVRVLPFNLQDAKKAAEFAKLIFSNKEQLDLKNKRSIIPNDTKIFAQGETAPNIKYFVTADQESKKIIKQLTDAGLMKVEHLDIHTKCSEKFGFLDI